MITMMARYWWLVVLRGVAAVLFGIGAFLWPGLTLTVLILLFGAYALVDGIFAVVSGFTARGEQERWWAMILEGLVGIAAGVLTFVWPGTTAFVLLYLIAAWSIITGVFEIMAAIRLRREIEGEWLLGLAGAASVLFGVLLFLFPGAGALTVVWMIGGYAILFGILMIVLGVRMRGWRERVRDRLVGAT
jgi:uncharacterized membrane protein HdeD (DUF308 family)